MCARVRASVCVCLCVCVSLSLSLCMCVSVFVHVCCHKTKGRESTAYFRRIAGASHSLTMSTSVTAMIRSKSAASKLSCSGEALNTTSMPRSRSLSRTAATASTACHAQRERESVCVCACGVSVCVIVFVVCVCVCGVCVCACVCVLHNHCAAAYAPLYACCRTCATMWCGISSCTRRTRALLPSKRRCTFCTSVSSRLKLAAVWDTVILPCAA